ncbi:MAG: CarD family transcriptional regulator, partial [Planctomycetota bacterium]
MASPTTTHIWQDGVCNSAPAARLADTLRRGGSAVGTGARGSVAALLAGAAAQQLGRTVLLVVAHLDEADDAVDDLESLSEAVAEASVGLAVHRFGALEVLPGESGVNLELLAERLAVVEHAAAGRLDRAGVIVAPVTALMQPVPEPDALSELTLTLRAGEDMPPGRLLDWLDRAGYRRQDAIEQPGDFSTRGGIVDVYPVAGLALTVAGQPAGVSPIRLDYFGDEVESIRRVDPDTMGSGENLQSVGLIGGTEQQVASDQRTTNLLKLLPDTLVPVLHETLELQEQARGYHERLTDAAGVLPPGGLFRELTRRPHAELNAYSPTSNLAAEVIDLPVSALPTFDQDAQAAVRELAELADDNSRVTVVCGKPAERDRLKELLDEFAPQYTGAVELVLGRLHRGFIWSEDDRRHHFVPHHELFHRYETRRRVRRVLSSGAAAATSGGGDAFLDLEVGDYVVHVDHGIAKFTGLKSITRGEKKGEYLTLQFADAALLHVPAGQIDLVQKYVGGFEGRPPLSALGGKRWKKQKDSVADAVKDMAAELLRVQAARETQPGVSYPADTP